MNNFQPDFRHYGVVAIIGAVLGTILGRTFGDAAAGAALYTLGFWLRGRTEAPGLLQTGVGLFPKATWAPGVNVVDDPRFSHTLFAPRGDVQPQIVTVPASDVQHQIIDVPRTDVQPQIVFATAGGSMIAPFPTSLPGSNGAV